MVFCLAGVPWLYAHAVNMFLSLRLHLCYYRTGVEVITISWMRLMIRALRLRMPYQELALALTSARHLLHQVAVPT
jgi:hypothetical protein